MTKKWKAVFLATAGSSDLDKMDRQRANSNNSVAMCFLVCECVQI